MKPRKIIWAFDPFAKSPELQRSAASAIRSIQAGSRSSTIVQPVHFSFPYPRPIPRAALKFYRESLVRDAGERLRKISRSARIENLRPLRVVFAPDRSVKARADSLLAQAAKERADLIVISSRARKGLSRLFVGSFAETLLLQSPLPVLVVNPSWRSESARFKRVLFPTDFSEASFVAFLDALPLVERWGARLEIYHKVQYDLLDVAPFVQASNVKSYYSQGYRGYLEHLHEKAGAWQLEARHYGVTATVHFNYSVFGDVAEGILRVARRRADIVAMAATSGIIKTKLMGSVTRRIVREARCPVWVLRPGAEAAPLKRIA
jgi:nucleotide-binding universal stress UspA family protein